ncbi:MAG: prolyl-tRNA synthetase associated domain-containing protein [Firmicutes bacterium]|nr:prolyl-tRNA synthetase associated domain-containing protein [Bacillota bacterium]
MNKQDIYNLLKDNNLWHEITEHGEVYTMKDLSEIELPYPQCDAKNILVRDDKKINYYLITVKNDKRVDLKDFQNKYNTRRLSFASENDLLNILNLTPGSVTPFGLLNDEERKVQFYIDKDFWEGNQIIGVHPNENTATVWIKIDDLIQIIRTHGVKIVIGEFN